MWWNTDLLGKLLSLSHAFGSWLWFLCLCSLRWEPPFGQAEVTWWGPPEGLQGWVAIPQWRTCVLLMVLVRAWGLLLSQPCHHEGSQAVWQVEQSLSCEVFRHWVGKALSNLGAVPALTWRLDRDQPELS